MTSTRTLIATAAMLAGLLLAGCGTTATADPAPPASGDPAAGTVATEPPATAPPIRQVGQPETFDDGTTVTITSLRLVTASDYAAGADPGQPVVVADVQITAGPDRTLTLDEVFVTARVGFIQQQTESVYDMDTIPEAMTGTLPPGRTAKGSYGFAVPDGEDAGLVTVDVQAGWDYETVPFEGAAS